MPGQIDSPRVNGDIYGWASISVTIDGNLVSGLTAVNWSETFEQGKQWGLGKGRAPRGRTAPKYDCEGSIEMPADTAQQIRKLLQLKNGNPNGWVRQSFDVVVQFSESILSGQDPQIVELLNCRCASAKRDNAEGTDASMESWDLSIMDIRTNGVTAHDSVSPFGF